MPKRVRQHQLEDQSRYEFAKILPESWLFRDKGKDYGVDGEVELFTEKGDSQGLLFWVQLKATDSNKENIIRKISLRIETLQYYKEISVPTLLIRYSSYYKSIYYKWLNNIDLTYIKEKQKNVNIYLEESDLWMQNTPKRIEILLYKQLQIKSGNIKFPYTYNISIKQAFLNFSNPIILQSQIKEKINQLTPYYLLSTNNDESYFEITIQKNDLIINFCNLRGIVISNVIKEEDQEIIQKISTYVIFGIAKCLSLIQRHDECGRIIYENKLEYFLHGDIKLFRLLISSLLQSSYYEKTFDIIEKIEEENDTEENMLLRIAIEMKRQINHPYQKSPRFTEALEKLFLNRIQRATRKGNKMLIGSEYYNLANFYHNKNSHLNAISNYKKAKQYAPLYKEQSYFYSELGSVCYNSNKFCHSVQFYRKAIKLGEKNIYHYYGDALLQIGEFEQALLNYDLYNKENKKISIYLIKSFCLDILLKRLNLKTQIRKIQEANQILLSSLSASPEKMGENSIFALNNDFLNGTAWFNLGIFMSSKKDYDNATLCFTMACICDSNDIESWANSICMAFSANDYSKWGILLINIAYSLHGETFLSYLYSNINSNPDPDITKHIAEICEKIIDELKEDKQQSYNIRLYNEKTQKFENLFQYLKMR